MTYQNYMRLVHDYSIPLYMRVGASNTYHNLCQPVDSYSGLGFLGILWHTHSLPMQYPCQHGALCITCG